MGFMVDGRSQLIPLFPEDRAGQAPKVAAEDGEPLVVRQVRVKNLGQLGRIRPRGAVAAPNETLGADFPNGKIDLT